MAKKKIKEKAHFLENIASKPLWVYGILAIISIALFAQCLTFDFTYHDDLGLIKSSELTLSNLKLIFQKGIFYFTGDVKADADIYYRPMQNVVYAFGNAIGGHNAPIHHAITLLLHILASCLLFNFFIRIGYKNSVAFLASCLFAVHPLMVQAVAWIPGVGELLIAIFLLLSFIYMDKFLKEERINWLNFILSLIFFLLALLSKESAVGFIPVAVFYILFFDKNKTTIYWKLFFYTDGLIVFSAAWYMLRQRAIGKYSVVTGYTIYDSMLHHGKLVIYYIAKIFLPFNLSPLLSPLDAMVIPGFIVLTLLIATFFIVKGRRNFMVVAWGAIWYLVFLLPTLYLINSAFDFYAYGHRLYLPIIGIIMVFVEAFSFNGKEYSKPVLLASFGIPIIVFFCLSFSYCKAFKNKYTFNQTTIDNSPHALVAFKALGAIYLEEKRCDTALLLYKKAVELDSTAGALVGLVANTYSGCLGDIPHAIEWYTKSFMLDSTTKVAANTAISMGNIYQMSLHYPVPAKHWYMKAIQLDSSQSFPCSMLGNILLPLNTDSAAYYYRSALRKDSTSSGALNGLGLINFNKRNFGVALIYFKKALPYDSTDAQLLKNIVLSYQQSGDYKSAAKYAGLYKLHGGEVDSYMSQYFR